MDKKFNHQFIKSNSRFISSNKDHENHPTPDDHRYPGEQVGKIQINDEQYFDNIPFKAWELTIGGYQPAETWLKDRRDRTLNMEEIQHYQKIIVALMETARIMEEIDGVGFIEKK